MAGGRGVTAGRGVAGVGVPGAGGLAIGTPRGLAAIGVVAGTTFSMDFVGVTGAPSVATGVFAIGFVGRGVGDPRGRFPCPGCPGLGCIPGNGRGGRGEGAPPGDVTGVAADGMVRIGGGATRVGVAMSCLTEVDTACAPIVVTGSEDSIAVCDESTFVEGAAAVVEATSSPTTFTGADSSMAFDGIAADVTAGSFVTGSSTAVVDCTIAGGVDSSMASCRSGADSTGIDGVLSTISC